MRYLKCLILLGLLLLAVPASAQEVYIRVLSAWSSNPTEGPDLLVSTCLSERRLYIVYFSYIRERGSWISRLEVRELSSGALVAGPKVWEDVLWRSCTALDRTLYLAGYKFVNDSRVWAIASLSLDTLEELRRVEGVNGASLYITFYRGNLVIAGWRPEESKEGSYWRVELRDPTTLELLTYVESDPKPGREDYPLFAAVNPRTGHLWVVGTADFLWYVEVYGEPLERLLVIDDIYLRTYAQVVIFDEEGYVYVGGGWGLVKLSWNGSRISMYTPRYTYFLSLALHGGYIVAIASTYPMNVSYYLYVFDRNLNPILIEPLDVAISREAIAILKLPPFPSIYSLDEVICMALTEYLKSGTTVEEIDTAITLLLLTLGKVEPTTTQTPSTPPSITPRVPEGYPSWLLVIASLGLAVALATAVLLARSRRS